MESAEEFLLNCFDFEKERSHRRKMKPFTLERVQRALVSLEHPEDSFQKVHVAGTKGKGSTVEYIYRLLNHTQSIKIGLFTSPHLISIHERIRIGEVPILEKDLLNYAKKVQDLNQTEFEGELTFFEILFQIALLYFKDKKVDWVLLETGLGGRLDATNAIHSEYSVLTRIDYDHCEILGNTIEEIATEKAAIIKSSPVIALKQSNVVNDIFASRAKEQNVQIFWADPEQKKLKGQGLSLANFENYQLASSVVEVMFPDIQDWPNSEIVLKEPISGRIEFLQHGKNSLCLDVAHNAISLAELVKVLQKRKEKKISFCFAMAEHRNPEELLQVILPMISDIAFVELPGGRPGCPPEELLRILNRLAPSIDVKVFKNGVTDVVNWIEQKSLNLKVVTGSFYLVGAVKQYLAEGKR